MCGGDDEVTLKQSQTDFPHFLGGVDACHPDSHIANNKTSANLGLLCDGVKVPKIFPYSCQIPSPKLT